MLRRRKPAVKNQTRALILLGAGLILMGVATAVLLFGSGGQANGSTASTVGIVPMAVEYAAPELALPDLEGVKHSLADYRGQVVLVNNWATWCPPCKAEMPTLQAYFDQHQADGFTLVAIEAGGSNDDVRQFVDEYGLTFPVWVDQGLRALGAFRNDSLPSSYVIDRQGVVRYAWTGPISDAMLEKYVTPLVEE